MMEEVERRINEVIDRHLPVTIEFVPKAEAGKIVDLSKLPEDASETLRIVRIGDYDTCACIGAHVNNTSEIGHFKMLTYDYTDGRLRLRFAPSELFNEATMTLLMPSVRSLGPLTMEQVHGAIPSPLPLGQSFLVVWPQLTGLIAATVVCFALSYVSFMRKEVRSR